jgi:hypothetical protein
MVSRVALLPLPTAKAPERIVPLVSIPNTISDPPWETMVPLPMPPAFDEIGPSVGNRSGLAVVLRYACPLN